MIGPPERLGPTTLPADPGIDIVPIKPAHRPLRVLIEPAAATSADPAELHAWQQLRTINPRLFDGPILALSRLELHHRRLVARRDRYRRLAVQPGIKTGVTLLGITGVLIARDEADREHVLLGQRSAETRQYGGLWECAPSGGLDDPGTDAAELDEAALRDQLHHELAEELDLSLQLRSAPIEPVAIVRDHAAASVDLVFRVEAGRLDVAAPRPSTVGWEYQAARWVSREELARLADAGALIPPTRALARWFAWI